ncbi:MAG TPA: diaminopimelate decarboxylase [Gemmatimonadaceae bacterium]|nr:diaminopimelate decarboxylase [Gemmatimonadaceae bacterium]
MSQVRRRRDRGGRVGEGVLAAGFSRAGGVLACEGIPLPRIADAVGTPVYVYSTGMIREQYARLIRALAPVPHRVHYSMKANSNHAILALLRSLGAGVDIVSGGELYRALRAGMTGRDVVFSGVGKTANELREALDAGVLLINVESEAELRVLDAVAGERALRAPVALRVNPEVTVDTPHRYTRTGEKGMKFGIPIDEAPELVRLALALPNISLAGLDMHVGSQVSSLDPYREGTARLLELVMQARADGARELAYLDVGGGLAVAYQDEDPIDVEAFAAAMIEMVAGTALTLIVEPGRFLVGNAGVLLTRVLYRKRSGGHEFIITDAGMNDLLRPSHYDAYHHIEAIVPRERTGTFDVVGPVCESGDFLALGRTMEAVEQGDLLAVRSAGAYGFTMSSSYNSRPRVAEVVVDGDRWAIATERERHEDLVRHERTTLDWNEG